MTSSPNIVTPDCRTYSFNVIIVEWDVVFVAADVVIVVVVAADVVIVGVVVNI